MTALAAQFPVGSQNIKNGAVGTNQLATGIVLQLASTGTARKIAFGTSTVTFGAATGSGTDTVTHGLGAAPVVVVANPSNGNNFWIATFTYTSTQFSVQGLRDATTPSATFPYAWIAIG